VAAEVVGTPFTQLALTMHRLWLMRNKNGYCRRREDRPTGAAEEQLHPPRFRVAAHDQQIIVPELDQLPKRLMFFESGASENIGNDFDSMICQMLS